MNRIDDQRVAFYLRNQALIEEWSGLASSASSVAHAFLCSCADDLSRLAADLAPGVRVESLLDSAWPKLLIVSPMWLLKNDPLPRLGIGIEWHKTNKLGFTIPERCAFSGVWVNNHLADGLELSNKLKGAFAQSGLMKPRALASTPWWPAYRWEKASSEYWNDLSAYRAQIVESVRLSWKDLEPVVRDVLAT
jgi:hypothetical protein